MRAQRTRVLLLIAGGLACRDPDQVYRQYATHAEAVAAGEVQRGWLPEWVPKSATDLHMQSDVDNNQWWMRLDLPSVAAESLRRTLVSVPAGSVSVRKPSRSGAWWFEGLKEQQAANDAALYAHLYRGSGTPVAGSIVMAFDPTSSRVYIWISPQ